MQRPRRLFVPELPASGGVVQLPPESAEHAHVLRLREGSELELFDAAGQSAAARILSFARGRLECEARPPRSAAPVPLERRLQLVVCLPKADKLEAVVRMATELGVHALHLATSERAIPKPGTGSAKLERLRRVAREACAQSGQPFMPTVEAPAPLTACAARAAVDARKLVFWEEAERPLAAAWSGMNSPGEVWAIVGPEGGLAPGEIAELERLGFVAVGLGAHILRAETACVVIAALLLERMGALAH